MLQIVSRSLKSKQRMTIQEIMAENRRVIERMDLVEDIALISDSSEFFVSGEEAFDSDADGEEQRKVHSTDSGGVLGINDSRLCRILRDRLLPYTYVKLYWAGRDVVPAHRSRNIMLDQVLGLLTDTVLALDLDVFYDIYTGAYSDTDVDPPLPTSSPKRMGRRRALTSLTLTLDTNLESITDALDRFLEECPDLRRLSLHQNSNKVDTVELSRLLRKNCPKLTEFAFNRQWDMDAMINLFPPPEDSPTVTHPVAKLQEMTINNGDKKDQQHPLQQRGLRSFSYTEVYFDQSRDLISTLQNHWSTLESIEIDGLRILPEEIEMFLTHCPRLEHLSINATEVDTEFISFLYISSFRPSTPWACLGLKSICLEIGDGCFYLDCEVWLLEQQGLDPSLRSPHPDVLSIYQRLSQLTALESVQLGFSHDDSVRRRTSKSDLGFDFSLASGLHLLKTLKSLKKLTFFKFEECGHWLIPEIGQAEVEWMAEHWPELQEIQLNIQRPEEGSAGAEQWRWLKETRPDINVRFAGENQPLQ